MPEKVSFIVQQQVERIYKTCAERTQELQGRLIKHYVRGLRSSDL